MGLISTCNIAEEPEIGVETSGPLLWTISAHEARTGSGAGELDT